MRTRRSGPYRYIDVHLVMPRITTVAAAHTLTDRLEQEVEQALPNTITTIHIEPCDLPEARCDAECAKLAQPLCASAWRAVEGAGHERQAQA